MSAFKATWKKTKSLRRWALVPVEWFGIAIGMAVMPILPRRVLFALCDALSSVMFLCDYKGKRRALEILRVVKGTARDIEGTPDNKPWKNPYDPTPSERKILRRSYRNMTRTVGYAFWTCFRARARCAQTGLVSEEAHRFLSANPSAITVSAHLGCWEILSQLAFLEGHRMMSVARNIGTGGMTRLLIWARQSIGQEIIPFEGAFRTLLQGIRDGKSLGLLVDQRVSLRRGGIWIRFFNRPMTVSAAPAFFAAKAKKPVVVAWSRPLRDGRYRCEVLATHTPDEARDIRGLTQKIADELSAVIRRHPSCWILNYNYFASRLPAPQ